MNEAFKHFPCSLLHILLLLLFVYYYYVEIDITYMYKNFVN